MKTTYEEVMKQVVLFSHRHWVDRYMWEQNKALCDDELWMGRFIVHRLYSRLDVFSDGSGAILQMIIRLYDKKTHKRKDIFTDPLEMQSKMFFWMNEFITNDVGVWENEDPYNERKDWRLKK